jgi:tripartite-type tricarboxylate transporter receptor subunit TctC
LAALRAQPQGPAFGQSGLSVETDSPDPALPAGGSTDIVARLIGQKLTESWGQPVLVDNRPGAGGNVAAEAAARAPPDGYTLFQVNVANAIGATLYPKLSYDLVASFAPVIQLATTPYVLLAHPAVPARTTKELIALAKARPGQLNYASAGGGSATHLSGELLKTMSGTNIVHIPYKGTGPAVTALLSGEVDLYFATVPAAMPLVKANKLRALGVTSARRSPLMPDVPAIAEAACKVTTPAPGMEFWCRPRRLAEIVDQAQRRNRAHARPARRQRAPA